MRGDCIIILYFLCRFRIRIIQSKFVADRDLAAADRVVKGQAACPIMREPNNGMIRPRGEGTGSDKGRKR